MHIDCDIYSSTKTIFNELSDLIKPGCVIVFDELLHYGGFENNEIKAFYEFLEATGLNFEWLAIRNKVMSLDDYFNVMHNDLDDYKKMSQWRRKGYEQEVAVMIT